jgi:single-strand DNA-binding protein
MSLNKVLLIGNLGADPELRYTQSQNPVCSFNIATNERRKSADGEWVDHTEWHSIVTWGRTAENCSKYIQKGSPVFIEGRLQTRKWQDQEGKDRYKTEIVANNVQFLSTRSENRSIANDIQVEPQEQGDSSQATTQATSSKEVTFDDDDIPF